MSTGVSPKEQTALAARVARDLTAYHGIAYAQLSPELRFEQVSDNFTDLFSEPDLQCLGRPLQEFFWEFVGAEEALTEILAGKSGIYQLDRVNRLGRDGKIQYYNFRVVPLVEEQPESGLLLIVEDATRAGKLEQNLVQDKNDLRLVQAELARTNLALQRLNRLKSLFLSMAAHDMRAPLTAIMGYTELVRADLSPDADPLQREFLGIIATQVNWLSRLLKDLLDLDQIEQGKLKLEIKPCDLGKLILEVSQLLSDQAQRVGLSLNAIVPSSPLDLQADPERIRQVLYNLINNAIKYTPTGGSLEVKAWEGQDGVYFYVLDNGRGMTEEEKKQLFQIYYRTEKARRSEVSGTGLGLFIVNTMVTAHNGTIEVETQPEKGTRFTVRLPFRPESPA